MKGLVCSVWLCIGLVFILPVRGWSQNVTYHLHSESIAPWGVPTLATANPNASSTSFQSSNLKGVAAPWLQNYIQFFRSVAPTASGTIPANSTITFSIWMDKTSNFGTIYPYFKVWIYGNNDPLTGGLVPLCTVTGMNALTTTAVKYNLSCVTAAATTVSATQAFRLDVGFNLTTAVGNHNTNVRVYCEGTLNGNFDSKVVLPLPAAAAITALSPSSGPAGTAVTITGLRFGAAQETSSVTFAGHPAVPTAWSDTSIQTAVPLNTGSGPVVVTVGGFASNGLTFTVPPPVISAVSPSSGPIGMSVTLTGSGFGASQGSSTITFAGHSASPTSWSAGVIQVPVPAGATTGSIIVTVGGIASNGSLFTVAVPTLTSISPSSGAYGTNVTLTGANFGMTQGTSAVTFAGHPSVPSNWSDTNIQVPVPASAATGPVVITVGGVPSNGLTFTVPYPTITNMSPVSGAVGTLVTLTGTGFGPAQGTSTVTIGGQTAATPVSWSDTRIQVPVPVHGTGFAYFYVTVGGRLTVSTVFTITNPIPAITSVNPSEGGMGTYVTVTGSGFGSSSATWGTTITFNGTKANPVAWSDTSIYVSVPGATTGPVVVTVFPQSSNGVMFTVPEVGTLSGVVRRASDNMALGGIPVKAFQAGVEKGSTSTASDGSYVLAALTHGIYDITAVPAGYLSATSTGNVVVDGQTTTVDLSLSVPVIHQLTPSSGPVGTTVTIDGSDFGPLQGDSSLKFNGVVATPVSWSGTRIIATVPPGTTSGPVVLRESGVDSNGVVFGVGTGTFNGTVTRLSSGMPLGGVLVEWLQANSVKGSINTMPDGDYSIANLTPGSYDLRFSINGLGTVLRAHNAAVAGGNGIINAALPDPGSIGGRVTKVDGIAGISGATVTIFAGDLAAATTTTDSNGYYLAASLSGGRFTVSAAAPGYRSQSNADITVTAGSTTTSDIQLTGQSTISYTYDNLGRLATVSDSLGGAAAYHYDAVGNLLSITNP